MRCLLLGLIGLFFTTNLLAQVDAEKIYDIAEEMPLIPTCAIIDTSYAAKKKCTQDLLLDFIYRNVQYPDSARFNGVEGTVAISFVIGKDSTIQDAEILKDIGGGCGAAALYVINAMNPMNLKWIPGKIEGMPVNVRMTIPVKFKIKEIPPYIFENGDTVYTEFEQALAFKGGDAALTNYLSTNLAYPQSGVSSCGIGTIEAKILVKPSGKITILEMHDFNNLGIDFQFEAISTINGTTGQWESALYKGRKVPTSYVLRVDFQPKEAECQEAVNNFQKAQELAVSGSTLFNQGEQEAGMLQLNEAIALFPNNAEYLYARGQAHLELKNMAKACEDLSKVKELLLVSWVDNLLPFICAKEAEAETDGN